jgi:hypothetical protein
MYLSKPILFIIVVVVLFIGGTSGLIYNVKGSSKRGDKCSGKYCDKHGGKRSGSRHDDGSDSDSSSSDESYSSSSDSGSESGWLGRVVDTKDRNGKGRVAHLAGSVREGFADSIGSNSNVKCMPGCKMATSVNGDCRWLPKNEPRHKQRLICPHTCDTGFKTAGARCESNVDCTDCTPQPDFTVTGYTSFEVTQSTPNANCTKGAPCVITSSKSLEVCNPYASPNNPAQNLICAKKPGSESEFVWTEADSAAKQMPYHVDQSKLLACDLKQGCAVEGDTCTNSNFDKVYCHNNIWVSDPKYDKSSYSKDKKGSGTSGSSDSKDGNNEKGSARSSKNGAGTDNNNNNNNNNNTNNNSDNNRDNYYITNYFYGPSKPESKYSLGFGFGIDGKNKKAQIQSSGSKLKEWDENDDDHRNKPGFIDTMKKKFQKNKKNKPEPPALGPGLYGGNYGAGVGGNAMVPPLVPKGEVATVQAYESTIKF